jgi:hypothetical protein
VGVVIAAALVCTQTGVATAAISRGDAAATGAFLAAGQQFFKGTLAADRAIKHRAVSYVDGVAASCADVLVGAPLSNGTQTQQDNLGALEAEAQADFFLTSLDALSTPVGKLVHAIGRLHWSRAAVTRKLAVFARQAADTLKIHITNVCADIRSAAATSFKQVPAAAIKVVDDFTGVQSGAGWPQLLKLVAPYENASLRRQASALKALQTRSDSRLSAILEPQFNRLGTVLLGPGA